MKRFFMFLTAAAAVASFSSAAQAAPILTFGDVAFKFNDVTYFDAPAALLQPGQPTVPGGTGSGITFGIANVTSVHKLLPGSTIENPIMSAIPIWTPTATDLLQVRYGGAKLSHASAGAPVFPWNAYFSTDPATANPSGDAYVEIYSRTSDGYGLDVVLGPDGAPGINPVTGAYGSFGSNIAGAGGSLWLDIKMATGILPAYDPAATVADVEITTINSLATGSATIYGDVVGGTVAGLFVPGVFPLANLWGTAVDPLSELFGGPHERADIKFKANLTAFINPTTGAWNNPFGWTQQSDDPVTGNVVPEPGTMLLMGSGLLGLAGYGFTRRRKKA